jgi:hypothetical protein
MDGMDRNIRFFCLSLSRTTTTRNKTKTIIIIIKRRQQQQKFKKEGNGLKAKLIRHSNTNRFTQENTFWLCRKQRCEIY